MEIEFKDKFNRIIKLPKERIKHIFKHPEMQNKINIIEETILNPNFIEKDLYRRDILYYFKYIKEERKHLRVVVKIKNNYGKILTAYLIKK